jgi:hypothetical protein
MLQKQRNYYCYFRQWNSATTEKGASSCEGRRIAKGRGKYLTCKHENISFVSNFYILEDACKNKAEASTWN